MTRLITSQVQDTQQLMKLLREGGMKPREGRRTPKPDVDYSAIIGKPTDILIVK